MQCPLIASAALVHPFFERYTGKTWQTNSICFVLNTNIFYGKKYQQVSNYFSLLNSQLIKLIKKKSKILVLLLRLHKLQLQ